MSVATCIENFNHPQCNPRCQGEIHYDWLWHTEDVQSTPELIKKVGLGAGIRITDIKELSEFYETINGMEVDIAYGITFTWLNEKQI